MNSKQTTILATVISSLIFTSSFLLSHIETITFPKALVILAFVSLFITMGSALYKILGEK